MRIEFHRLTQKLTERDVYPNGANSPTHVTVYKCLCGGGTFEYHRVPGFDDDYTVNCCPACKETYSFIDYSGRNWKCYLRDD